MSDCDTTFEDIIFKQLPKVFIGSSWQGFEGRFQSTGTEFVNDLDILEIAWFDGNNVAGPVMTSAGATPEITISDATTWSFQLAPITPSPFQLGTWRGVLKATDSTGFIRMDASFEQPSVDPMNP